MAVTEGESNAMKKVEFVSVDARRWAWLHLPLALVVGVVLVVWYFIQKSGDETEVFVEGTVVVVILFPVVVAFVMALAWLQAASLNLFLYLMGKGPIFEIRAVEDKTQRRTSPPRFGRDERRRRSE